MTDPEISRAGQEDIADIVASAAALFREDGGRRDPHMDVGWPDRDGEDYYAAVVTDPASLCLLARSPRALGSGVTSEAEAVGHLIGRLRPPDALRHHLVVADLESMRVDERCRNQGVGARLVEEFLAWARQQGAQRASVTAYADNRGAIRFYEAQGFNPFHLQLEHDLGN